MSGPKQETSIGPPPRRPADGHDRPGPAQTGATAPPPGSGTPAVMPMPAVVVPPPPGGMHDPAGAYRPPPTVLPADERVTVPMPARSPASAGMTQPHPVVSPMPATSMPAMPPVPSQPPAMAPAPLGTPGRYPTNIPTRADGNAGPLTSAAGPIDDGRPTVADSPSEGTDRNAMSWQGPSPDTANAPHLGVESATSVGLAMQPTPGWVWLLTPAIAIGVTGSAAIVRGRANAGPPPAAAPADDGIDPELLWLADVNETDPARVRPYAARHAALDKLQGTKHAAHIDRRLNVALDLRQAVDSPEPCRVYADALAAVAASPEPYFSAELVRSTVPTGDDTRCEGLAARRDALLADLGP